MEFQATKQVMMQLQTNAGSTLKHKYPRVGTMMKCGWDLWNVSFSKTDNKPFFMKWKEDLQYFRLPKGKFTKLGDHLLEFLRGYDWQFAGVIEEQQSHNTTRKSLFGLHEIFESTDQTVPASPWFEIDSTFLSILHQNIHFCIIICFTFLSYFLFILFLKGCFW